MGQSRGPPDVVSFALTNFVNIFFTQGTEEKKKAKAECAKYALRSLGQHPWSYILASRLQKVHHQPATKPNYQSIKI